MIDKLKQIKASKTFIQTVAIILALMFSFFAGKQSSQPDPVEAQEINYACIGNALARYLRQLKETTGSMRNVKLLSPAFNMTNPYGAAIAKAINDADPNAYIGLAGVAGNAYNCCSYPAAPGGRITEHVAAFKAASGINLPVLITETGVYDGTVADLKNEMDKVQLDNSYIGALLFNGFNTNAEWERYSFATNQIIKDQVCGESCHKLGVNSATYFPESDGFYDRAAELRVDGAPFFTLSISNADNSTLEGVQKALSRGLTPVIRVGDTYNPGPDAIGYGQFLKDLDDIIAQQGGGTVYAIAGPNEPQSECWAAPECGCELTPFDPEGIKVKRPLTEGFYLGKYSCDIDDVADPEFHALRPYPASSCDLLIPRSIPEAPRNTLERFGSGNFTQKADYLKYNTFACGSSIDFTHQEVFDPYGYYAGTIVGDSFGNQYLHTYCDFESITPDQLQSTGYYDLTCYRTVGYEVYADFSASNIGILGNTQSPKLSDEQKATNYLSYFFTGTVQIADRELLDPEEPNDIGRLVNYSGPLRKLLPYDAIQLIRGTLIDAVENETGDIHNYALNDQRSVRMESINPTLEQFFPNIPNSSLEDIAGEGILTSYGGFGVGARSLPATAESPSPLSTAPYSFNIICGVGAHLDCPPGSAGVVSQAGPGGGPPGGGGSGGTPSCLASGCMGPEDVCCSGLTYDESCPTTGTRCATYDNCTLDGQCLGRFDVCCGSYSFDESCPSTGTRCGSPAPPPPPACSPAGACKPAGGSCCLGEVSDFTCFDTRTRCSIVAPTCTNPGTCKPEFGSCCLGEVSDFTCFDTGVRCTI